MESEGLTLLNTETVTSGVRDLYEDTTMKLRDKPGQEGKRDIETIGEIATKIQFYSHCDSVMSGSKVNQIYKNSCQTDFTESRKVYPNQAQSPDTRHMYPSQTQSPDTIQFYPSQTQSPDTEQAYPIRAQSPDTIPVYPSQSQSPDTCQTSQVSSSVSESLLYRQSGKTDNQDSNWDINDPDIPARIEQYVSSCLGYLYYYFTWI